MELKFTDRYGGKNYPDPKTMCDSQCPDCNGTKLKPKEEGE